MEKDLDLEEQYDKIYRYCYFRVHQREAAEDITQETFLRFLKNETYRNNGRKLQYLYTIARNLCADAYRREKKQGIVSGLTEDMEDGKNFRIMQPEGERSLEERLVESIGLRQALSELGDEDREMILLRYANQIPVGTIAGIFGLSRFVVYRRLKQSFRFLQERLDEV